MRTININEQEDNKNSSGKKELIKDFLKQEIIEQLQLIDNDWDDELKFDQMGVDSFMTIDLHKKWRESFPDLPATFLMENNNINDLVEYFYQHYYDYFPDGNETQELQEPQEIKDLSEEKLFIKQELAEFLDEDIESIDETLTFDELGVDSFMTIDIHRKWREFFSNLPATFMIENNTIDSLAYYLSKNYYKKQPITEDIKETIIDTPDENEDETKESEKRELTINQEKNTDNQYAIVGLTGRYPEADNIFDFWNNLLEGKDCSSYLKEKRLNNSINIDNKAKASLLQNIENFDADFFGITKEMASEMDPQERILLEQTWNLLADSGISKTQLSSSNFKVGCFIGSMYSGYGEIAYKKWMEGNETLAHSGKWIMANKLSNFFNLKGPSLTIDTACSSSMAAIHYACNSISNGECEMAIAGGINLIFNEKQYDRLTKIGDISKSGSTKPFNKEADGFVEGEGVGLVMIKKLKEALHDNDYIYGTIRSSAINTNSGLNDVGVPELDAKEDVMTQALNRGSIEPNEIDYVEAHAMGTLLGDSLEVRAINKVFKERKRDLIIGTVKGNIGHTEACSGVAALTKVLLEFKNKKFVPTINSKPISEFLSLGKHMKLSSRILPFNDKREHLALINSSGAGGTNVSLIVEEFNNNIQKEQTTEEYLFSAQTINSLRKYLKAFYDFICIEEKENQFNTKLLAKTLKNRNSLKYSIIITAEDISELKEKINKFVSLSNDEFSNIIYSEKMANSGMSEDENKISAPIRIPIPGYVFDGPPFWLGKSNHYSLSNPLVKGHISFGKHTVLGAQLLIMSLLNYKIDPDINALKNVSFDQPMTILDGSEKTNNYEIINNEKITIRSKEGVHFRGEPLTIDKKKQTKANEEIKPCPEKAESVTTEQIYQQKSGVYSDNIQVIDDIRRYKQEVWAKINLSNYQFLDLEDKYSILIDAAFLTRLALNSAKSESRIPFYIKNFEIVKKTKLSQIIYVYLNQKEVNEDIWRGDVQGYNDKRELIFSANNLVCKSFAKKKMEVVTNTTNEKVRKGHKENITNVLVNFLEDTIGVTLSSEQHDSTFMQLGCTSKDLIDFSELIQKSIDEEFLPTYLFEYQTINKLKDFLSLKGKTKGTNEKKKVTNEKTIKEEESTNEKEVAIIGISGKMPNSSSLNDFFTKLTEQQELIEIIPNERWDWRRLQQDFVNGDGGTLVKRASFIKKFNEFDNSYFGITPKEATLMDPQHRICLELAVEAIEDAGYSTEYFSGTNTSIFIGTSGNDYLDLIKKNTTYPMNAQLLTGNSHNMLAGRISHWLNLRGQSKPIDTACSSSLVAIYEAVTNIRLGNNSTALVGGVNLVLDPDMMVAFDKFGILNRKGKCKAFDTEASGTVRGEGAGFILLKSLKEAQLDNDHIYGVIKGVAVNHDGKSNSLTSPNMEQQKNVIKTALKDAEIEANSVSFIESHGTATKLGDPIEFQAIKEALFELWNPNNGDFTDKKSIMIGSLKNNIGHLEAASGMASLFKVLFSLKSEKLIGDINREQLSPYITTENSPFYFSTETSRWETTVGKRIAGISAFGFSGTNAHIIVEEYKRNDKPITKESGNEIISLSANNKSDLQVYLKKIINWLRNKLFNNELINTKESFFDESGDNLTLNEYGFSIYDISKLRNFLEENKVNYDNITISGMTKVKEVKQLLNYKDSSESIDFLDVVNTLKFSRTSKKIKLFFKAANLKEMYFKLMNFEWEKAVQLCLNSNYEDIEEQMENKLNDNNIEYLYYSDGHQFDLSNHINNKFQKLSLPTYPFNRKKFWYESNDSSKKESFVDFDEELLLGHKLNNVVLIPGAYSLAKMYSFIKKNEQVSLHLKDITWNRRIVVKDLKQKYEVSIKKPQYQILDTSNVPFIEANASTISDNSSSKEYKKCYGTTISSDEFYRNIKSSGFQYSDDYQVVSNFIMNRDSCNCFVKTRKKSKDEDFHFLQLEGAFQAAGYLLNNNSQNLLIPYKIKSLNVYKKLSETCEVVVNKIKTNSITNSVDIYLFNDQQELCLYIENYQCQYVKKEKQSVVNTNKDYKILNKKWGSFKNKTNDNKSIEEQKIFFINMNQVPISKELEQDKKIFFFSDLKDSSFNENNVFQNISSFNHFYRKKIGDSANQEITIIEYIDIFEIETIVSELLNRYKVLVQQKNVRHINYVLIVKQENKIGAAINGMIRSFNLENKKIFFKLLSVDSSMKIDADFHSKVETIINSDNTEFLLKNLELLKPTLNEITDKQDFRPVLANCHDVWIIGGVNGIGGEIAKELVKRYDMNIYISGLSDINKLIRDKINEIATYNKNCEIKYLKTDINSKEDIVKTKNIIGKKNIGVIFGPGLINDSLALNKSVSEFKKIIDPKTKGLKNLINVLESENVLFTVLLSSITALFGNIGQSDYAFANGFLDQEALTNNNFKMLSINLPALKDGRMQKNNKFTTMLKTNELVNIMESYLGTKHKRIIIIPKNEKTGDSMKNINKLKVQTENVKRELSRLTGIEENLIKNNQTLEELGIDSILTTELIETIEQTFKTKLDASFFYSGSINVDDIVNEINNNLIHKDENVIGSELFDEIVTQEEEYYENYQQEATQEESIDPIARKKQPEIAIIGFSGEFPSSQFSKNNYENLFSDETIFKDNSAYFDGNEYKKYAFSFDNEFFGISTKEAYLLDPQQRKMLESVWNGVEDAGYDITKLKGTDTGIFIGASNSEYAERLSKNPNVSMGVTDNATFWIANKVSQYYDFHGPSEVVDSACSSSLSALHRACLALKNDECSLAIVGGVNILSSKEANDRFKQAGLLSESNRMQFLSSEEDGLVRTSGWGVLVLKRLEDAKNSNDNIQSIILNTLSNHNGRSNSQLSINSKAIQDLVIKSLCQTKINPSDIQYIEMQGNNSVIADQVEFESLIKAFTQLEENYTTYVGSTKQNIGHLEAASGIASVIKLICAMKRNILPSNIKNNVLSSYVEPDVSGLVYSDRETRWNNDKKISLINSFGAGGSNVSVLLGNYQDEKNYEPREHQIDIVTLSANSKDSLISKIDQLYSFLCEDDKAQDLKNIAYTLNVGRAQLKFRIAFLVKNIEELKVYLKELLDVNKDKGNDSFIYESSSDNFAFIDSDLTDLAVKKWFQEEEYEKVINSWKKGLDINWEIFYESETRKKIRLPLYPFESKIFLLEEKTNPKNINEPLENDTPNYNVDSVNVEQPILDILHEELDVENLRLSDNLSDIGIDSFSLTKLRFQLQNKLGVSLSFKELGTCKTVSELYKIITRNLKTDFQEDGNKVGDEENLVNKIFN